MAKAFRRLTVAVLATAVAFSASCSGNDDDDSTPVITDPVQTTETSDSTTSSTTSTTTDPDAEVKADVEAAYLAYWEAFLDIYAEPNPENPLIEQHTTGVVKQATLDTITQFILDGESIQPPTNPEHWQATILSVDLRESQADVVVCAVDGGRHYDNAADSAINDDVVTKLIEASLVLEDAQWKVADSNIADRRDGVWDCGA